MFTVFYVNLRVLGEIKFSFFPIKLICKNSFFLLNMRVKMSINYVAHLAGLVEERDALASRALRLEHDFAEAEMLFGARVVVDAAFGHLAALGAHLLEELAVDVVVKVGECDLFGRHRAHPILVVLLTRSHRGKHCKNR